MKVAIGYIMASKTRVLYIGCTSELQQRVWQHKTGFPGGFTERYTCHRLVFMAEFSRIDDAVAWERAWKGKSRAKKIALVEAMNPGWDDLAAEWFEEAQIAKARQDLRARRQSR